MQFLAYTLTFRDRNTACRLYRHPFYLLFGKKERNQTLLFIGETRFFRKICYLASQVSSGFHQVHIPRVPYPASCTLSPKANVPSW